MTELVGFKENLLHYKGGWAGNEIYPNAFTPCALGKKVPEILLSIWRSI